MNEDAKPLIASTRCAAYCRDIQMVSAVPEPGKLYINMRTNEKIVWKKDSSGIMALRGMCGSACFPVLEGDEFVVWNLYKERMKL